MLPNQVNQPKKQPTINDFFRKRPAPNPKVIINVDLVEENVSQPPVSKMNRFDLLVGDEPHQPTDFNFPSSDSRRFKPSWFKEFTFLSYVESSDKVICFTCAKSIEQKLADVSKVKKDAFLKGFNNWKKVHEKCRAHQLSELHRHCMEKRENMRLTHVNAQLLKENEKQQEENRMAFLEVSYSNLINRSLQNRNDVLFFIYCYFLEPTGNWRRAYFGSARTLFTWSWCE